MRAWIVPGGALVGLLIVLILVVGGPRLMPYGPDTVDFTAMPGSPSPAHPFGTTDMGEDIGSRVLAAYRVDLRLAGSGLVVALLLGSTIGSVAGWSPARIRALLMTPADTLIGLPRLVMPTVSAGIALLTSVFPWFPDQAPVTVVGLLMWPAYARLAYTLIRDREPGVRRRLIRRFRWAPAILFPAQMAVDAWSALLIVAWVGLLRLGPQPPATEWGAEIAPYLATGQGGVPAPITWWVIAFPILALFTTAFFLALLSRTIRHFIAPTTLHRAYELLQPQTPLMPFFGTQLTASARLCPLCADATRPGRQYCISCGTALVGQPVEGKNYVRSFWRIALFMVLSFGIYILPWCYRSYRFANAVWASRSLSKRRNPWLRCLLLLIPLYNLYVFYRLAADIEDATGNAGDPPAGSLATVFGLSFFAEPLTPLIPGLTIASIGLGLGTVGSIGCLLSLQRNINRFFRQDDPSITSDWQLSWYGIAGCVCALAAWTAGVMGLLARM